VSRVSHESAALALAGEGWCSASEQQRLLTLQAPARRAQFLAGRWLMRSLLAQVHGGDALCDWPLTAEIDGPPQLLRAREQALYLSISHSGDWVACAVSGCPVGIDVECPRRVRDVLRLARWVCNPSEQTQLAALQSPAREALFYRLWAIKEARFKQLAPGGCPLVEINPVPADAGTAPDAWTWQTGLMTLAVASAAWRWVDGAQWWPGELPHPWHLPQGAVGGAAANIG
jgi:4'-phosphopantetheinyl transferase